jgi:hypothetical protein
MFGSMENITLLCITMKDQLYNTITQEQLEVMMNDTINKLETAGNENDLDQLLDDCESLFFDLNDENYTLSGMSVREADDFVKDLKAGFHFFIWKNILAVSKK